MTQTLTQAAIEAAKEEILSVREANNLIGTVRPIHAMPRSGG